MSRYNPQITVRQQFARFQCEFSDAEVPDDLMASAMVRLAENRRIDSDKCRYCEEQMGPDETGPVCAGCAAWFLERQYEAEGIQISEFDTAAELNRRLGFDD